MTALSEPTKHAMWSVAPLHVGEIQIRDMWPSVTAFSAPAALGKKFMQSILLAPLGWFMLLPLYFFKVMPFIAKRYRLTNQRLLICRGLTARVSHEIKLSEIDDVRIADNSYDPFFRAGTLEIISAGQVAMKLVACSYPDAFRIAILSACKAWAPKK
jgi:hypothetical protein